MAKRKLFMGIGASVARLKAEDPARPSESTTKCLIAPNIASNHPVHYDKEESLIPLDLTKQAGICDWDTIEHDGWGLRTDGGDMNPSSKSWEGVSVTSIGFHSWPMHSNGSRGWAGAVFLHTKQFAKYRDRIEAPDGRTWGKEKYKPAELTAVRYEDNDRYLGFIGQIVDGDVGSPHRKVQIFRAGKSPDGGEGSEGEVAGTWWINFNDSSQIADIESDALNAEDRTLSLPTLGARLGPDSPDRSIGYIFLNLKFAAANWDKSDFGYSTGLTGPKLPFWLGDE